MGLKTITIGLQVVVSVIAQHHSLVGRSYLPSESLHSC